MSQAAPRATSAFVGLGSNLEDPVAKVKAAMRELGELPGTVVRRASSLYRTAPIGYADQPEFINAVVELATELDASTLLAELLAIEGRHGRVRSTRNAPRTLDLDLLLFGEETSSAPGLSIPHPRMHERAFVLVPLAEIAPDSMIPGRGRVREVLAQNRLGGVIRIGPA